MFVFTGRLQTAAMKFYLIAVVAVLALAQGSFAQDVADFERIGQYLEELKNKMTQELSEIIRNPDLTNQAQTFLQDKKTQLQPLASQIQDQLKTVATNVEEQIMPLAVNMQAHLQPIVDTLQKQMEAFLQQLKEKAISN
uniref:Antifreeze protein type IV n=1 Tax=Mastacembelus armatus TaxID=205130 RepID=A0A7N8YBB3_9TELE